MEIRASLKDVYDYFGGKDGFRSGLATFRKEWDALTAEDRIQLQAGIGNRTLTY